MYTNTQKLAAEFLGTFALVFFGAGAICADQFLHGAGGLGLLGVALAHGLALAIMISALGHISGGHFNPAVTIGYWVTRRQNTLDVILYWIAQLAGAIAAAFLLSSHHSRGHLASRGPRHSSICSRFSALGGHGPRSHRNLFPGAHRLRHHA